MKGHPTAMFNMGADCFNANNHSDAIKWYTAAMEKGEANAAYGLGVCYYGGHGIPRDFQKAFQLFLQAAQGGNVSAMFNTGVCYLNGEGTQQNREQAIYWYKQAAQNGDQKAKTYLISQGITY